MNISFVLVFSGKCGKKYFIICVVIHMAVKNEMHRRGV